jgi:hypothetical protein
MLTKTRKITFLSWASAFLTVLACGLQNRFEKPEHSVGTILSLLPAEQQSRPQITAIEFTFDGDPETKARGVVEFFGYDGKSHGRFDIGAGDEPSCWQNIQSDLSHNDAKRVFCHGELDLSQIQGVKFYGEGKVEKSATQISLIRHNKEKSLTVYSATL